MDKYLHAMGVLKLRAYEIFKRHFGEKDAETIIEYCESKTGDNRPKINALITKSDLANTKSEIIKWMFALFLLDFLLLLGLYFKK